MKNFLVLDVGGSSIKFGVFNEDGKILVKSSKPTPLDLESFYSVLKNIKEEVAKEYRTSGVAFSLPGAVDKISGIIYGASALPYIHNFDIKSEFVKIFGTENLSMENDANCAALAEVWSGVAKEKNNIMFVVVGSGIGGAIVKDRKIHSGANLHGGEFGYIIMDETPEGEPIIWSRAGSTINVARRVAKELGLPSLTGEELFKLAEEGNQIAKNGVDYFYKILARGIFNIQFTYDPEMVVIGGGISARPDLLENVNKKLDEIYAYVEDAKIRPDVQICKFNNDANLIGALFNLINK